MVPSMATNSAAYVPFAWRLTREQIGLCLSERYRVPKELPSRLLSLSIRYEQSKAIKNRHLASTKRAMPSVHSVCGRKQPGKCWSPNSAFRNPKKRHAPL